MRNILNTIIAICLTAIPSLSQTNPSPKSEFKLEVLRQSQISEGCGEYYRLSSSRVGSGDYIFATAPDRVSKAISIDGRLHVLKRTFSWSSDYRPNGGRDYLCHFVEAYSDLIVRVELRCSMNGEVGEGATISGKMRVTVNNLMKVFTIDGELGCD